MPKKIRLMCVTAMTIGFIVAGHAASASTYYVSPAGSDKGPGTKAKPFKTIQRAAGLMKPGDTCYIRAGTYRETVRPARSGEPGKLIRFEAYLGETATISGADPVKGWKRYKGSIYKTKIGWKTEQVFVDGRMMIEARWPNTGLDPMRQTYAKADEFTALDHIGDLRLGQDYTMRDGYWDGALLWVECGMEAKASVVRVKKHEGYKVRFDLPEMTQIGKRDEKIYGTSTIYDTRPGNRYYLTRGPLSSLDAVGEWWSDPNSRDIYLWSPEDANPANHLVEAKRMNLAFDLSGLSYITLRGLSVFAATATLADAKHCLINDCHFRYVSHVAEFHHDLRAGIGDGWNAGLFTTGIVMGGMDNELCNSTIVYSAGNGVVLLPDSYDNRVINCLIHEINYTGMDCQAVRAYGYNQTICRNTMYNTGDSVITHHGLLHSRIEYNHLYNPGMINHDLGCTYSAMNGDGTIIAYNWCHNVPSGSGIYIDCGASGYLVHHNVVWNTTSTGFGFGIDSATRPLGSPNRWYNNTMLPDKGNLSACMVDFAASELGRCFQNNILAGELQLMEFSDFPAPTPRPIPKGVKVPYNIMPPADPRFKDPIARPNAAEFDPNRNVTVVDRDIWRYFRDPEHYDFRLVPTAPAVDVGTVIPPISGRYGEGDRYGMYDAAGSITGKYSGKSPDIGAYEGDEMWIPGCTLTKRGIKANGGPLILPKNVMIRYW